MAKEENEKEKNKPKPCPKWLNDTAKKEWRRVAKILAEEGKDFTDKDLKALEAYCINYAKWQRCEQIIDEKGYSKHIRAVIKAYRSGKITKEKLLMKYASWEGHAKHADTYRLRMKIKGQIEAEIKKKELIGNGSITPDN